VILLPLAYESPSQISIPVGAALYSGVLVAVGLTIAVSYNLFFIAKARAASLRLGTIDPRTGLANRREFELRLQTELSEIETGPSDSLAIVMLDLDNFKNVNTLHGHNAGDVLLEQIAEVLGGCARSTDCVARVGGDEFAVIIPGVDADAAQRLARRLVDGVSECTSKSPLVACKQVTASAGVAVYGLNGNTFEELVTAADDALMSVKESGKGTERVSGSVA
jgi:diguanylate cyclase (GGDEF)-like protein